MKKQKVLRVLLVVIAVFAVIFFIKTITPIKEIWEYRFSCILCSNKFHDETYYSDATISPDNIVAYFKTEVSYIDQKPIFILFIGEESSTQYYKKEKISLCTNNLAADKENCFLEIKDKVWQPLHERDWSKEAANMAVYWDKDGNIIYGVKLRESVFGLEERTIVGKIDLKTYEESILSYDYESYQKLWSIYGQYINQNKILISGKNYGSKRILYLADVEKKNVCVYIIDPKIKKSYKVPGFITYEFFKENLGDERLK